MNQDIQRIGKLVASINELVNMGLLQKFTSTPNVYVVPSILQIHDKKYMKNCCSNFLKVWAISNAAFCQDLEIKDVEIVLFNKENGEFICRYSENKGLIF